MSDNHKKETLEMHIAIQCEDARTRQVGTFGYTEKVKTISGDRFYSKTPVFDSLYELYPYMKKNKIKTLPAS